MTSLYDQARALFTPELMDRLETYFGETTVPLDRAVRAAVSSLVSEAIDRASNVEGATKMLNGLHHDRTEFPLSNLRAAVTQGQPIASALLGDRFTTARDLITNSSNVTPGTATGLLALAAPLVMSMLAKLHIEDPTAFENLLASERTHALEAGPASVAALVEDGGFSWRHLVPMVLMGALLVTVPFLYRGCGEAPAVEAHAGRIVMPEPKPETISLPNGGSINVLPGTINHALAKYLAGTENPGRRFTFDHLNFDTNRTDIVPESRPTLGDLVTILKSYPAVDVVLEGHTDSVGDPVENKKLSVDRAAAIKSILQMDGIAAQRITTAGYGEERPLASNETEAGRSKNRRLELVVAKK